MRDCLTARHQTLTPTLSQWERALRILSMFSSLKPLLPTLSQREREANCTTLRLTSNSYEPVFPASLERLASSSP